MADRDTSGTGGPNPKASDPMGRNQTNPGQPGSTGQSGSMGQQSSTDRMTNDLSRMSDEATESGRQGVNAAQGRIRSLLEQQSHRAADQLGGFAHALHKAAEQLSDENNGAAARYADQAAERVEHVADMLRNSSVDDMVRQVEGYARRQPEVFVGAAFAIGFLFARFIKSSGERRQYSQSRSRMGSGYGDDDFYGRSDTGRAGSGMGMSRGMDTGMYGGGTSSRGMAGGIAGSAGPTDRTSGANYATTGTTPAGMSSSSGLPTNSATAATSAARTRDAAELMAGGSPEPIRSSMGATSTGMTGATTPAARAGDMTLGTTSISEGKPQGTRP